MTQEEKQLLFKVLCEGLPYGVKINIRNDYTLTMEDIELNPYHLVTASYDVEYRGLRPYLRPIDSITKEEEKEWEQLLNYNLSDENEMMVTVFVEDIPDYIDWFNKHHFDYRGLIDKSLALEAPEGMYKTE